MSGCGVSWADKVMASLDERAAVLRTARGDVQLGREGQGPPVLVSHGGPGGFDLGLAWPRHLRDGGCELIAPSRPGYLRTPLQSGRSPESQADLYAALLDALDIRRVAVLGFSAGGPAAVHFAARYPDRTKALFLDAAILFPFEPPISAALRATYESGALVWLSYQIVMRRPDVMARFTINGVSKGLTSQQKSAAASWITSDPVRLHSFQEQFTSTAPAKHRRAGSRNDDANQRALAPLPFGDVTSPTVIAHGTNDAIVPLEHARKAASDISGAELVLVEEGHHILPLSPNYGPVARLQLELAFSESPGPPSSPISN